MATSVACTRTHVPQDSLQCSLHVCLHGAAQGYTQLCCSKLRFVCPADLAHLDTCYPDNDFAQNPENMDCKSLSSGSTVYLLPHCSHSCTPPGVIWAKKHTEAVLLQVGMAPQGWHMVPWFTAHASAGTACPNTPLFAHLQGLCLDRKQPKHRITD